MLEGERPCYERLGGVDLVCEYTAYTKSGVYELGTLIYSDIIGNSTLGSAVHCAILQCKSVCLCCIEE